MLGFLPTRAYRPATPGATTFLSPLSGTFNYGWDSFVGCSEPLAVGTEAGGTSSFVVHEDVKQSDRDAYVGPPLEISNELLPGDPDHFSVIIGPGGTSRTMIQDGTDVLFDMFGLIDVPGLGVFDSRDGTLPERVDEGTAQASFTFPCGPGLFDVTDVAVTATILSGDEQRT